MAKGRVNRMRFCLIGCGEHAESSHAPALVECAARLPWLERVACCDLDPARAERVRQRAGFARAYSDAAMMVAREHPDAVAVVVPPTAMTTVAPPLLEAGVPLLLEKPPGITAADVDLLRRAAARGSRPTPNQVAFNRRFAPVLRAAREILESLGGAGAVQHVQYEMTRVARTDPDFTLTAVHAIDAARFLAGSDYAALQLAYVQPAGGTPGVVNYLATGTFASGASVHLACCPAAGVVVERAVVHAGAHTLFAHVPMWAAFDAPGLLQHLHDGRLVAEHRGAGADAGSREAPAFVLGGFLAQYLAFFEAVHNGRPPSPDLDAARQSVEVADAMRQRRGHYIASGAAQRGHR